ncbi:MAG: Tn7 transposase TnsA N-terminal domain-containing protein [Clostridiales bacterium]|nr:Tn7 transposase TnsA N-terminal domain-containing protein [Clostridiales bacterium]
MYSKNYKGRCDKRKIGKCEDVIRCYDAIMTAYVSQLEKDDEVVEVRVNVPLDDFPLGEFTTDFVCTLKDGSIKVRECVFRDKVSHPIVSKKLDASRVYWLKRGVENWGLVVECR